MDSFVQQYFLLTGAGWAVIGAMAAVMFGGIGSAPGIRIAAAEAAGAISEKPELFGKTLVLAALPGTQGFYGFIIAILILLSTNVMGEAAVNVSPLVGVAFMFTGILAGIVQWKSAVNQGEVSAACINLTVKRPEEGGRAILLPVLVETYAVVALLAAILVITALEGALRIVPAAELIQTVTTNGGM